MAYNYEELIFAFLGTACGIKIGLMLGDFLYRQTHTKRKVNKHYTFAGGVYRANRIIAEARMYTEEIKK